MQSFTLAELARKARVSARTVRYYIQRGLLHAPEFRGPDTQYEETHLLSLQVIRLLQDAYWPLDAIAPALHGKSVAQLRAMAAGTLPPSAAHTSPPPTAASPTSSGHPTGCGALRGTRFNLAEGLELWLEDDASAAVRRVADVLRTHAAEQFQTRKRGEL
jgi:DNA-binding transcriptional MerR regulator